MKNITQHKTLETVPVWKILAYEMGRYTVPASAVSTDRWTTLNWIKHITVNGTWTYLPSAGWLKKHPTTKNKLASAIYPGAIQNGASYDCALPQAWQDSAKGIDAPAHFIWLYLPGDVTGQAAPITQVGQSWLERQVFNAVHGTKG